MTHDPVVFSYHDGRLEPVQKPVVQEHPLLLIVNGREIATLISSPHDLRFLAAGFLRLQGFIHSLSDLEMFSVCEELSTANIRIKGELPQRLQPVLTSGCGTGITFTLPSQANDKNTGNATSKFKATHMFKATHIFSLMDQLALRSEHYKNHGGIHSAAVGREGRIVLYAEDIGRHNTLDRIAGEAFFKGMNLQGTMLVTSGRVSSEMAAKAAMLGISLIASRTSPTDMAIRLCQSSGICLVGYVRGGRFTVYAHPEMIEPHSESPKIDGITGVILAGGRSSRMGSNKALLQVKERRLIELVYERMSRMFREVLLITNEPELYDFLPCRTVQDVFPGLGSLAGVHAGLTQSFTERIFVAACDMPALSEPLIRRLCELSENHDVTVPLSAAGLEPLHAVYGKGCIPVMKKALTGPARCIYDLYPCLDTLQVPWEDIANIPGAAESFHNINTPGEFQAYSISSSNGS